MRKLKFNYYEMYTINEINNEVRNRILDEDIQTCQSLKVGNYSISVGDDDNLLIKKLNPDQEGSVQSTSGLKDRSLTPLVICEYKNNDWKFGGISLKDIDATLENHFLVLKKIQQCLKEAGLVSLRSIDQGS